MEAAAEVMGTGVMGTGVRGTGVRGTGVRGTGVRGTGVRGTGVRGMGTVDMSMVVDGGMGTGMGTVGGRVADPDGDTDRSLSRGGTSAVGVTGPPWVLPSLSTYPGDRGRIASRRARRSRGRREA